MIIRTASNGIASRIIIRTAIVKTIGTEANGKDVRIIIQTAIFIIRTDRSIMLTEIALKEPLSDCTISQNVTLSMT